MQLDITSALFGGLLGLVLGIVLSMRSLKQLHIILKRIGFELGVEAYREEKATGVTMRDVNGNFTGDIAGRDIHKTSNLYKMMQAAVRSAQGFGTDGPLVAQRRVSLDLRSVNNRFVDELNEIQRNGGGDWFEKWVEHSLANPEFRRMIDEKVAELQRDGWNAMLVEPSDNINRGLMVNIVARRQLE